MKLNGKKLLFGLLLALPAWGSFARAGSFSGATYGVLPGVVNSGGQDGTSASHNIIAGAGEIGQSTYTSASHILQPGFARLMAWPQTILNLSASTGAVGGSVLLTWTAPKADGSTGTAAAYEIHYSSVAAKSPALSEGQFLLAGSVTDFITVPAPGPFGSTEQVEVTGLVGGATYYFAVKAKASWDGWSYLSNGTTSQARLNAPAFNSFTNVYVSSIQFNWSDSANIPGLLYRVLVSTAPDPLNPAGAVVTSSDTYNFYLSSTGLSANTTYYFRAAGLNERSVPPVYSAAVGTSTLVAYEPVFTNFTNVGANSANINWAANGNPYPETLYQVLASTAPDPLNPAGAAVTASYTNNLYLISSGLNADTTYYFSVAGVNHNGVATGYTSAAGTSTLANMPVFVSFTDVQSVSAQFNWSANGNREPGTLYRVFVSTAPDPLNPAGAVVTSSDTYEVFLSSSGLASDTAYYFTVAAINNNGIVTNYIPVKSVSTLHVISPVFWAAGTAVGGTASVTPAWPAHQTDDLALLIIESAGTQAANLTTANGFVRVSSQTTGTILAGTTLTVYWARAASSSMASPVVTDSGDHTYAVILTFRYGIKTGDPWDVFGGGVKTPASASVTVPGVTTTVPETLIVTGVTKNLDSAAAFASNWTNANLATIVERFDAGTISGNGGGIAVMTGNKASVGATGNTTATVTSSVNAFLTLALKPQPPLPPPNIAAITDVAARAVTAGWDLVGGATGYTLAASLGQANPPSVYASSTTMGDLSATVDTPVLTPNTTYYLFVRSNGPGESSAWSAYPGTSTLLENDPAFTGFTDISSDTIRLNWSANGNADPGTLYRVVVSTAPDPLNPGGAVVTASDTYNTFLSSSGLAADTVYNFGVAGINNNNVPTNYIVPQGPATLLAHAPVFTNFTNVGAGTVQFNWSANGNADPGTHYRVLASTAPDPLNPSGAVVTASNTYNTFLSSAGLNADTTYYFIVAGLNKDGAPTSYTASQSTATLANAPVFTDFTNVGADSANINWSANLNPDPGTLYRVLTSTAPDPLNPSGAVATASDTYNTSLSSAGLSADTTYYFRVAAVNKNSILTGYTAAQSTATLLANAPVFTNFTNVGAGAVQFNWSANGNADPGTLYRVLASTAPDPLNPAGAVVTASNTYNVYLSSSGLNANTTCYFRVAGINKNNVPTAYTVAAGTSTLLANAPVFTNFTNVAAGAVQFNWSANGNPYPGTRYRVVVSTAPDPLAPAGAVATASDTYNVLLSTSGLDPNTTYYLSVAGLNNNGVATAYTSARATSTLAAQPSGLYFTGTTPDATQLNWSPAGNGPGTLYRVLVSTADPVSPAGAVVTASDTYNVHLGTSGLVAYTDYYFRAAAVNNNGIITAYTDPPSIEKTLGMGEIGSPAAGSITDIYVTSITANWSLVSGATGYTLAASINSGSQPSPINASSTTVGNGDVLASVPGLSADTVYYLFARANGPGAASAWFAYTGAATLLANPPVFTNFTNVGTNAADFNWSANGNTYPGTKFRVLVSTAPDPLVPSGAVVTSSDTYNISLSSSGLAADTTYYFRAAGINKDGAATSYTAAQATATWANAPVFTDFTDIGASAIQFNWSANGNPYPKTLYRVLVSTAPDPLVPAGAVVTTSDTYNVSLSSSGLAANATYYFRVGGLGNNGSSTAYTAAVGTSTLLAAAPVFTNFTNVGAGTLQFNWSANGNAYPGTKFRVLVSTVPDPLNPGAAVATTSDTYNVSLSSSGLPANTTYYFRVAGVNNNSVLTAYAAAAGTATLANIPLTAVSTFSAVTDSGFMVSWNNNSNPLPGTLYTVQVSTASDFNAGAANQATASTAPAAGPSYTFTGLSFDTVYYFQVRAANHNGVYTDYAPLGSTKTLALPAPVIGAVTNVQTNSLSANWQLVNGATGYTLAASINPGSQPSPIFASSDTLGGLNASVLNPALAANTTYYLFVRSNGPGASSPWSAYPGTSTLANIPLTAASTFSAVGFNSFSVSWDNNSNPLPGTLYNVQVSTAYDFNSGVTDQVAFSTAPAAGPSAEFTGLNVDTWYYFRVRAVNNNGVFSDYAELGQVKTKALPVLHSAGDGVVFYGQAGNTMPQFRNYYSASNSFGGAQNSVSGEAGSLFVIKTNPLSSKQEAVAGYVKDGTLHMLCTDGTNWSEDWTQYVGGNETTRRFDISYETNSGDVMVLYSQDAANSNELGYRTKPGGADCGASSWSGNTNLDPVRTTGVAQWVKMASDRRTANNTIAAIWADANSDLSAMVWTGTAWENEPSAALETSLEVVAAAQDVDDFDVEFESLSGDIMVVWANSAGANGVNGVRYAAATWTGGAPLHTWGAVTTPPTFADDATNLALNANPNTNEMIFASIGNAGGATSSDMQIGYWSGSAWTNTANVDITCQQPLAGTKLVAAGWITSGATTRWVVAYNDASATNIGWYYGTTGVPTLGADAAPTPAFASPQKRYDIQQDPVNKDRLIFTVSDNASDLFAKRLVMDSVPNFTWTDANANNPLETSLASTTVGGYSFVFWPAPPTTTFAQSAYRFFNNADTTNVGTPLAAQDTLAQLPSAGAAFRLRTLLHIGQVDLPIDGQGFKLQFAGKGDGSCDAPSGGSPAGYTDVTNATIIAFNDNSPADNAALTANANDPKHGAHTTITQAYEELNDSTNTVAAISRNQDGEWDFALKDNGVSPGTSYCFRLVKGDGADLNSYDVYPEVILPAPVYINEVYPTGADAASDWVELYNNTNSTPSLVGWKLNYIENTIDLGGTPNTVWTGQAGDVINAMSTFTITTLSLNMNGGLSYHVKLQNNASGLVDQVQWPAMSAGQSFARVTDGDPAFFEIDPTPTKNYANRITTDTLKINEAAYGSLNGQFIEIYNTSLTSTRTLAGYSLRNSAASGNGLRFRFTKKIYPRNYALLDFSSVSDDALGYAAVFGAQGLSAAGDFLALEDPSGSMVDNVTWQSDVNYSRYNYRAEPVSVVNFAPANAANSIMRRPFEGADTGNNSADFTSSTGTTMGSRNNSAGSASANTLTYPANTGAPQFLARRFPVTFKMGAVASSATANNIVFQRTGGNADAGSPHIYRLQDIGLDIGSLATQTTVQTGVSFKDQDGYPLIGSATYRVIFNTDTGAQSAPQITLGTVTYDASVHSVTGSSAAPLNQNNATRAGVIKLDISNNSPAGFNSLEVATVTFRIMNSDLSAALDTSQARNLFNAIMLVRDSTGTGVYGAYESGIDVSTISYVPMAAISLDSAGLSTLTVLSPDLLSASIPAASTRTFYIVFEATQNASGWTPNVFRVRFDPAGAVVVRDGPSDTVESFIPSAQVDTASTTMIAPAQPPDGTAWPYAPPAAASIVSPAAYYTNEADTSVSSSVYVASTDGYLRALKKDGTLKWSYPTDSLSPIRTSPMPVVEGGNLYLYFADDNGDVYKIRDNNSSWAPGWKKSIGTPIRSNLMCSDVTCSGDVLYFGAGDNTVRCLNKTDGTPCAGWTYASAITAPISGTMSIDNRATVNTGWIGLEDGKMVALKTGDGTSPTSYQTGAAIKSSPYLDARVADPNNVLYFTSTDGKLYARISSNLSNIPTGWSDYPPIVGAPIYTPPFVTWEGTKYIFFGDDAGNLHKVSTSGVSAAGWPFQAGGAIRSYPNWVPNSSIPQGGADYVYFGCDDGYIYAVNAETGVLRTGWPVATGGPVRADPIIDIDESTLVIGSTDGKTYTLYIGQ